MPAPKKSLLACVSAAALVASFGFVQAQDAEDNLNSPYVADSERSTYGLNDHNTQNPPVDASMSTMAADSASTSTSSDLSSTYAPTAAGMPSDTPSTTGKTHSFQRNVGIDGTPCIPEGSAGQRSGVYDPATSTCEPQTVTVQTPAPATTVEAAPVEPAAPVAATAPAPDTSNMTVTAAPETRVDLSPPSEPLYNLPERAPRQDRN